MPGGHCKQVRWSESEAESLENAMDSTCEVIRHMTLVCAHVRDLISNVAPVPMAAASILHMSFLALAYGGGEVYLARDPKGRSAVEALVGAEGVRAMSAHHRIGERVRPPLAKAWRAAMLRWQGHSVAHIARTLRASEGSVYGWLKKVEQ